MSLKSIVSHWIIPAGIKDVVGKAIIALPTKHNPNRALEQFRGIHKGKRCFVVATGPSVATQDLSVLEGEICIGVSFGFLHPVFAKTRPLYHVLAPNHEPFDFSLPKKYLEGLESAYSHKAHIFYGTNGYTYSAGNYLKNFRHSSIHSLHLVDYSRSTLLSEKNCMDSTIWDITCRPFVMRTVIYGVIQLAMHMGFSDLYLIGCDHDYLKEVGRKGNHFYSADKGNPEEKIHLDGFDQERWFFEYYSRWRDYRIMRERADKNAMRIWNATAGGMLDVFPRVELRDLFKPAI